MGDSPKDKRPPPVPRIVSDPARTLVTTYKHRQSGTLVIRNKLERRKRAAERPPSLLRVRSPLTSGSDTSCKTPDTGRNLPRPIPEADWTPSTSLASWYGGDSV